MDDVIVLYSTRHQIHCAAPSVTSLRVAAFDQKRGLRWSVPFGALADPHTLQSIERGVGRVCQDILWINSTVTIRFEPLRGGLAGSAKPRGG
jgi:hypothetical protein